MSDLGVTPSVTSPHAHRQRESTPDEILARIIELYPDDDKSDHLEKFIDAVVRDKSTFAVRACVTFYFGMKYNDALRAYDNSLKTPEELKAEANARKEETKRRYEEREAIFKDLTVKLAFKTIMANGLRLQECSIGYVKALGGVYSKIGERGNAEQRVDEVWTDEEIQALKG